MHLPARVQDQQRRIHSILMVLATSITVTACASIPPGKMSSASDVSAFNLNNIDTSKAAKSQESRVKFIILHYTALDMALSLQVLSEQAVSSHYLIGDDSPYMVYRLVDENRLAYHAGVSSWKTYPHLNANSIGIEIVSLGYQDTPSGRIYQPYPAHQIDALIVLLKDIVKRHQIQPENILGHSEIAPQRKPDPGPLFPWKKLADAGLVNWPDSRQVQLRQTVFEQQLPDVIWFQQKLAQHGYAVPQTGVWDQATRNVMTAFQTRYRPGLFDGNPDAGSAALLDVLTQSP
ncbi:N-acetylmuramoyl-L-alanine amidase [Undibacterium sp. RuTC16W]|uniref:N-acetylmuramoyl-L-alanine amidase n=1 Tax=Undibacterium sp. RuTC16W TaxID=3413048 RepID=UPI003BF0B514